MAMKNIFVVLLAMSIVGDIQAQQAGVLTDVRGQQLPIDSLYGKKCLVMILPAQSDTAITHQLLRFKNRFPNGVQVIGMVSEHTPLYDTLIDAGVFITTATLSAWPTTNTANILKWISERNHNRQAEPGAVASKYFISRYGRLYAQPGATVSLDAPVVTNLVKAVVHGEN